MKVLLAIDGSSHSHAALELLAVPALHKDGRRISIEFSIQFVTDTEGPTKWVVAVIPGRDGTLSAREGSASADDRFKAGRAPR